MHPGLASKHLAGLVVVGLAQRRRSGGRVYYDVAVHAAADPGFCTAKLVWRALCEPEWATSGWRVDHLTHLSEGTAGRLPSRIARVADVIFDAATAFGDVRRLQVFRLLNERGRCGAATIVKELRMSLPACSRHTDKLRRRGFAREVEPGIWALAQKQRSRFHGALGREVLRQLADQR